MKIEIDEELYNKLEGKIVVSHTPHGDDEDDGDEGEDTDELPLMCYEVWLYKNANAQALRDRPVHVNGANVNVVPVSETGAVMYVLNSNGQAVYCVAWELVAEVKGIEPTAE